MLVLCAYYEGDVPEQDRDRFDTHVEKVHLPLVAKYPGLTALRYLKGVAWNGNGPDHYLCFELYFATRADFDRAMGSEIRNAARADLDNFVPLFNGTVRHVLHEVNDIALPA